MKNLLALVVFSLLAISIGCQSGENNNMNSNSGGNTATASPTAAPAGGNASSNGGPSDGWISVKTKLALIADKRTSGFETSVDAKDGVVTLSGKVDTDKAKSAATDVAKDIKGVKSVDNQLQVVPDAKRKQVDEADNKIEAAVNNMIKNDPKLKDMEISATSNNGVVLLTGSVKNQRQLLSAATAVRGVEGVKSVDTHQVTVKNEES